MRPVVDSLGLTPLLQPILVSEEEGVEKPSPHIFQRASGLAGVPNHEVVHVGDELDA
jgi:HAD superfamily hydrolase (TIGR01549 family)